MPREPEKKLFATGMVPRPRGNAPAWVDYKVAFKVDDFIKTLKENADSSGWVNIQVKTSKSTGKQYAEIDTYNKSREGAPQPNSGGYRAPRPPASQPPPPPPFPRPQQEEEHPDDIPPDDFI